MLRQHARQHTGERPFACRAGCSAVFASRSSLLKHEQVHAKPHVVCPEPGCGFIAANATVLVRHARQVGHAAIVKCPFPNCDKTFTNHLALKMHRRGPAHSGEGGAPVCKMCGATFATVAEYTTHVRAHRVERLLAVVKARKEGAGAGAGAASAASAADGGALDT
jgi:hypothetical protein